MPAHTAAIVTIAVSLGIAFVFGMIAARLRLPPIVGYLVAGIAVGPFTPGYVVDSGIITQAAELGVVLLMFGVGLHFSFRDLMAVRRVVIPGALLQILVTGTVGVAIGRLWWALSWGGAITLGISLAVASTVVLLKSLEAQDRLDSPEGRLAVGWLVVEDLAMVVVLVLLPLLAPLLGGTAAPAAAGASSAGLAQVLGVALLKVAAFSVLMVVIGRRAVPWLLEHVAKLGSRELFTLAVLATALGVATLASEVFGVSFALGAFFAGAVVSESELSHRAATDALPLQDAFAVLFFLSVGMLFNPGMLTEHPLEIVTLLAVVLVSKFTATFVLTRLLREPPRTAMILAGSLAQIGEFSFIVAGLGVSLGLITRDIQAIVIAVAILAITLNQPLQSGARAVYLWLGGRYPNLGLTRTMEHTAAMAVPRAAGSGALDTYDLSGLQGHVVVVGHGRMGTTIAEALHRESIPCVIVEEQERVVAGLRSRGERAVFGDATRPEVLHRAGVGTARLIVVTAPEPFRARCIVELARSMAPRIAVAVRTHSATEQAYFESVVHAPGASGRAIYAEREAALSLAHYALQTLGRTDDEADAVIDAIRHARIAATETFAALQTREFRTMMGEDPGRSTPPGH